MRVVLIGFVVFKLRHNLQPYLASAMRKHGACSYLNRRVTSATKQYCA